MYYLDSYQHVMSDSKAARLKQAREEAGYETASSAADAFGWNKSAYIHHENGTRSVTIDAAKKYARAFRVNTGWLLDLDNVHIRGNKNDDDRLVKVTGSVAAGVWTETSEWPEAEQFEILVSPSPFPKARRFGLRVDGFSMDQVFPDGTILDCVSIFDIEMEPENGDLVIVERVRSDGMHELTVKEFERGDEGRTWLLPRSTKPEFQTPIEIGIPDIEHSGDDQIQVIAYVVGSYQPRIGRFMR
ncbi:XRE family transcriptional regulator [Parasphingorhabdus sp.]|uniref:LexA family protein n=1 Tax=Parasphingorhabdus sp. TaxID=2709688 RepID=UPI003298FB1F